MFIAVAERLIDCLPGSHMLHVVRSVQLEERAQAPAKAAQDSGLQASCLQKMSRHSSKRGMFSLALMHSPRGPDHVQLVVDIDIVNLQTERQVLTCSGGTSPPIAADSKADSSAG
jgi:hypothetical protein